MAVHKLAVLGAGNGGQALAGHLTLLGQDVSLYDIDREKVQALQSRREITLSGKLEGTVSISLITDFLGEALKGREIVIVTTTTDQHISLAKELAPLLTEEQIVLLCPGQTGGGIVVRNVLRAAGKDNVRITWVHSVSRGPPATSLYPNVVFFANLAMMDASFTDPECSYLPQR